jgi:hypothetical protein
MAFYGSSAANLSPILFKGNLFSEGVNIVFHTDVSYSMNLDPLGRTNYTSFPTNVSTGSTISIGSTISMFYDGLFPSILQEELSDLRVGNQLQTSPNLYTYIDQTLRTKVSTQQIVKNTETITFDSHVILADSNFNTERKFKNLWKTNYINNDQGTFTAGNRFNIANKVASASEPTRFNDFDVSTNPGQFSEDVHGNIWSLYYSTGSPISGTNDITEGRVSSSIIGRNLTNVIRKNIPTYLITASNEQENTGGNLVGIGISTKNNVGYSTDKYLYSSPGFFARRYKGYFLDPRINSTTQVGDELTTVVTDIENWINAQAIPWPFGNRTSGLNTSTDLNIGENAPGVNWFINGNPVTGNTSLGGIPVIRYNNYSDGTTTPNVLDTDLSYADKQIPKTPGSNKTAFWGPITSIDRLRSDINGYTLMIIGYFSPKASGSYKFRMQSNGAAFLWIGSDLPGIDGFGINSKAHTGYTIDNATLSTTSSQEREDLLSFTNEAASSTVYTQESQSLSFTAGRFYPFRMILGNPARGVNEFSSSGDLIFPPPPPSTNPSFVRMLFDVDASGTQEQWQIDGTDYFFGGEDVWHLGSQFFPPPIENATRTIEQEVQRRNLRVIGISEYESDDNYDAVFVRRKGQEYMYVNLSTYDFTFNILNTGPSTWRFSNYFDAITYNIDYNSSSVTKLSNTIDGTSPLGRDASFTISKLNDRYITEVLPGFAGTDFRVGDRFVIPSTLLGETSAENNLNINVSAVQPLEYIITTNLTNNFVEREVQDATFLVKKNELGNNTYTLQIVNPGLGYQPNDILLIPGASLDGVSPTNDITITVTSILSNGEIDNFTFSGTPTNFIDYTVPLNTYERKNANFFYEPTDISLIRYRSGTLAGIAYTTAKITGIAYTTLPISGIAQSSFNITGIAYTSISNPTNNIGIAYSSSNIVGIAYTILSNVGAAFTHGNVTGIAYTTANIIDNGIEYSTSNVISIGYTSPNIVSIGYTATEIASILYETLSVSSYELRNNRTKITANNPLDPDFGDGGKVIFSGTFASGDFSDNVEYVVFAITNDTEFLIETPGTQQTQPNPTPVSTPIGAFIITQLNGSDQNNVGLNSEAVLNTITEHNLQEGDSIILRNVDIPVWNSTFSVKEVRNNFAVTLDNTGREDLFNWFIFGENGLVGFEDSDLQVEVQSPSEYPFEVGNGITVYGITGDSSIYNGNYTIQNILESDINGAYKFTVLENQTPEDLSLPSTSGKIGIHQISGIATVLSTQNFGDPEDVISIKIQNSPSEFFNNVYSNAVILDSTRILLGPDSFRDENTLNPNEYSQNNADTNTIIGLIGDELSVTYDTISPIGYEFSVGDEIEIYNSSEFDGIYQIVSINGQTLNLNQFSNASTDFTFKDSGTIGIRNIGPVITFTNSYNFPSPYFGDIGSEIQIKLQETEKTELNTNTARNAKVVSANSILLTDTGFNPTDYSSVGPGGIIGLIGSDYYVTTTSGANNIPVNSQVRLQNINDQFDNTFISNNIFNVLSNLGNNTGLILRATSPLTQSNQNTDFSLIGSGGILGLLDDAIVTTSTNHPFNEGDLVRVEGTTGNNNAFNGYSNTVRIISPTSFILNNTNSSIFTDDFTDANVTGGIVGLENYPATVTSNNHPFSTGQTIQIENTTDFNGIYTISVIDSNRFTLDNKFNPISYTEISNSSIDPLTLITLKNSGPIITYTQTPRIVGEPNVILQTGDQIKIQNSSSFNGVYTIVRYTDTTFGISIVDPSSFIGVNETTGSIAGLIGSKSRVRSNSHGLVSGQSVKIQNTGTLFDNQVYTIDVLNANLFDLNGTESTSSTDFTITSSTGIVGIQNYSAVATFDRIIPSAFLVGSQIDIVGNDGTAASANTQQISLPGPYTIAWRTDLSGITRVGLSEAINPSDYTIIETNTGLGYTAGLRNSPARLTFSSVQLSNIVFGLNLNINDIISINISNTNNFNGNYTARYTSTTTLDLVTPSRQNPINYNPVETSNGLVGLANSNRLLTTLTSHGFTSSNIGNEIYINTGNPSIQSQYGGTYAISEILNSTTIALQGTENIPSGLTYSTIDGDGYYVIANRGLRLSSTYTFNNQTALRPHLLDAGDGLALSGIGGDNGAYNLNNYNVQEVINSEDLRLTGSSSYPSKVLDDFNRPDYKLGTFSGFYNAKTGPFGNSSGAAEIIIRRTPTQYAVVSVFRTGSEYKTNELYRVVGSNMGGSNIINDALIVIGSTGTNGQVVFTNATGITTLRVLNDTINNTLSNPNPELNYDSPFNAGLLRGSGSGAQFRIIRSGIRDSINFPAPGITTYSTVQLLQSGSGYVQNDVIRIQGAQLGGSTGDGSATNLQNDLLIYINQTTSGGGIGLGFTFTGRSRNSAPLINSGLSSVYLDAGLPRSRPYGLEQVWSPTTSLGPPPNQGLLRQTHDMLTLAEENKGGVIKIDKVYTYGDIRKKAEIQELFFYSTASVLAPSSTNSYQASIVYDTNGNSGIATIIFDDDRDDQQIFINVSQGDKLYLFTSLESNPNTGLPFVDYRGTNEPMEVIRVNSSSGTANQNLSPVNFSTGEFRFATSGGDFTQGFAFSDKIDQIVFQTGNVGATLSDNVVAGYKGVFINEKTPLTVRSDEHPFINGETVTIRFNRLFDTKTFVPEGTGIAFTSYVVRNTTINTFQLEIPGTGNLLVPSTIMPNGKKLIDYFSEAYTPLTSGLTYWTSSNASQLYGDSSWSIQPHPVIYANQDANGISTSPITSDGFGDRARLTRSLLSIEGEAYTLAPGGSHPIDRRVGLAKAIAKFIADTSNS